MAGSSSIFTAFVELAVRGRKVVEAEIKAVEKTARKADGTTAEVQVKERGSKGVIGALTSVLAGAKKVDGTNASVNVGERGAATTIAALLGVNRAREALDGKNVRINIDSSSLDILGRINTGLGETASRIRAFGTVGAVAGLPAIIAGIAGIVPVASAAGVAVTALAGGIGRGLAGAAAIGGGSMGALAAGLGLIVAPVTMVVSKLTAYKEGLTKAASAQSGVTSAAKSYQSALGAVSQAEDARQDALRQVVQATEDAAREQDNYNMALEDEPDNLALNELDLADARDRATDLLRDYNAAVKEYGVNSEEATDAARDLERAELGLSQQERDTQRVRESGSEQMQTAEQARNAAVESREAANRQFLASNDRLTQSQQEATDALKEVAAAEAEVAAAVPPVTAAQLALYNAFLQFKKVSDGAFLPAQDQVAVLGQNILKLAGSYMPALGKASLGVMQGLTRAFAGFSGQLSGPVEQAGITRLLTMLPKLMETAARAAGTFGLALFNVFARSLKFAQPLMSAINGVANRFLAFTESVSGQNQIDKWFATSAMRAKQLGTAILNLIRGFGGLFAALEASGATDRIMSGFVGLTRSFRQFTAEGSKGAASIQAFARSAQPTLDATWRLLKNLVGEWFRVAGALFKARDEAGKLIVPAALDGIGKALRPIGDLLIDVFTRFGPMLGPLVAGIVGLLNAFIAHNPVLFALSTTVVKVLTAFNNLNPAIKTVIVSIASIAGVIGVLGGLSGVVGGLVTGFGLLISPVGLAVAAIVAGAVLIYKNWASVKQVFAPLAPVLQKVKSAMGSVVPIVKNLGSVIKGLFTGDTGTEAFRKAFTSLPGPIQTAIKTIIVAWSRFKAVFYQVRAAVMPVLRDIGNGIKTGLVAAFKFLVSQGQRLLTWFKANWPQIRTTVLTVVRAVGSAMRTVLGGAFKFALSQAKVVVNWFKQNWPLIQRTAQTVFKLLKTVVGAIVKFWKANWSSVRAVLVEVWKIIKTTVSTFIKVVLGIIKATMQAITGDWKGAWNTIKGVVKTVWEAIKSNTKSVLSIIGTVLKQAWTNIKSITLAAWNTVRDYIKDKIQDAKERAVLTLKVMGQAMFDRYENMKRSVKAAFEAIKGFMVDPIESAYDGIKEWVGKILGVVNTVLEAVGLDPIKIEGTESPGGNGSSGRGARPARVARFAKGGEAREHRTNRFARGGLGTSGRQPRTHMWNEQMGNEAYIAEREPSNTQMPYLKAAAGWHGMDVVPRRSSVPSHRGGPDGTEENPKVHKHARGGISGLVRAFAYGGFGKEYFNSAASALDQAVMSRFPVDGSSYSGHPAGAVDFLVSSGQAQGQEKALGDSVAGWLDSNYNALNLRSLIWYARARYEGGAWQPYVDNYGGGSGDVASQMHYNHPHAESLSGSFGKLNEDQTKGFTGGGGGGGGGFNPLVGIFNAAWDKLVQPVVDTFLKPLKASSYVMNNAVGAAAQKVPDGIKEWILGKLGPGTGGSTQDPGQGGGNRAIGERMLKASGVPGTFDSLNQLWTKESNWEEDAQNPTSTAFGIPQFLDQTWQQYGGKSLDPEGQISKGLKYIADRYGGTDAAWQHSQANNWYSDGGMTKGGQRAVIGEAGPELVLPLNKARVMQSAQTALGTSELRAEVAQLREALVDKLDRVNLDTPSANHIVTGARNRAREVMKSTEGRGIIQTQNREIDKTQSLRRGR